MCILFGPQIQAIDDNFSLIHNAIQSNPLLGFLKPFLEQLPSVWSVLTATCPELSRVPGNAELEPLARLARGERVESPETPLNVLLTPLTVLKHITEFIEIREKMKDCHVVGAQGFCVGFIAAAAVSKCRNDDDFHQAALAALRLAVAVGAVVDLDSLENGLTRSIAVRGKQGNGNKELSQILLEAPWVNIASRILKRPLRLHETNTRVHRDMYLASQIKILPPSPYRILR